MSTARAPQPTVPTSSELEAAVQERYARGALEVEAGLCCPSPARDSSLMDWLPREIVERDYGCGDPAQHARPGEVVVDLGSGAGKACYVMAQKVGAAGRVIGLDANDAMLALARKHQDAIAARLGYSNVEFRKARIQDLALDLEAAEAWLREHPAATLEQVAAFEAHCERLRAEAPLVGDGSVDVVVSNCVLNLVRPEDKGRLFRELHRVLRRGGRAVISDIVCDEDPTPRILRDPALWSGCIAGAFREDRFLEMFEEAGFHGIEILARAGEPWQVLDGIEFRSLTVRAFKGKQGPCLEHRDAVIYRGPWKQVADDDGHVLLRGRRMAVCRKTYGLLTDPAGPYAGDILPVPPYEDSSPERAPERAPAFACDGTRLRSPRETKGEAFRETRGSSSPACSPDGGCC